MKIWTDVREWIAEEDSVIRSGFDSITAWTGEEGTGKSYAMLFKHKASDPSFNGGRVHFEQDPFLDQAVQLSPGQAIQLDEFDGHRRLAMHGHRMDFLKFLKEKRALRLRIGIGFPHIGQLDRDILRSRIRYRAHLLQRRILVVKERQVVQEQLDKSGNPYNIIRWPIRGTFVIPEMPNVQLRRDYDAGKDAFTHRNPVAEAKVKIRKFNDAAALEVIQEIKAAMRLT